MAAKTAYVITGLADVLAGTVQDVVRQGKHTYTERKSAGGSPVKDFARQMPDQFKGMAGEVKEPLRVAVRPWPGGLLRRLLQHGTPSDAQHPTGPGLLPAASGQLTGSPSLVPGEHVRMTW